MKLAQKIGVGIAGIAAAFGFSSAEAAVFRGAPSSTGAPQLYLVAETGTWGGASPKPIALNACNYQKVKLAVGATDYSLNGVSAPISGLATAEFDCKKIGTASVRFKSALTSAIQDGYTILPGDKKAVIFKTSVALTDKTNIWSEQGKPITKTGTANACGVFRVSIPQFTLVNGQKMGASFLSPTVNGQTYDSAALVQAPVIAAAPTCTGTTASITAPARIVTGGQTTALFFPGLTPGAAATFTANSNIFRKSKPNGCGFITLRETASLAISGLGIIGHGPDPSTANQVEVSVSEPIAPAYCKKTGATFTTMLRD